ncbi:ATP-binding cassette domain-containing protein [Pseudolysinimonas sp.]|uniref:ABC transporter ATP-binding protein/permease n=1 Tax=Pseudolysinimonas sp. TaxID=2680009 RepID=UPI0037852AEF
MPTLRFEDVTKRYPQSLDGPALESVSLEIHQGEYISITGPSGGGKTTLLNVLGLLDTFDQGSYQIDGREISDVAHHERAVIRSSTFGFVFQNFYLLDRRPAFRSAELGLLYRKTPLAERRALASRALESVGLASFAGQTANTLSGGQRQRVAIARALAGAAPVILADEPTGNLDTESSEIVIRELERANERGATLILVTHDPSLASRANRHLSVVDGHLSELATPARPRTEPHERREEKVQSSRHASKLAVRDALLDAFESIVSRPVRALSLIAAVALGIGLAVATVGISLSASAQVSEDFDAHLNRDVSVTWVSDTGDPNLASDEVRLKQLALLSGVDAVGLLEHLGNRDAQVSPARSEYSINCFAMTDELLAAARISVRWSPGQPEGQVGLGEALLGANLAAQLDIGPLEARPTILVSGRRYTVVGIVEKSPRIPDLAGALLVQRGDMARIATTPTESVIILTLPGAAQQVARQVPLVVDPYHPEALTVTAPIDPAGLRAEVEGSIQVALVLLTVVALAGAVAGLSNSMLLSVGERRQEIGLRSALGARPVHSGLLFLLESVLVGLLGGLFGLTLGLLTTLVATIVMGWSPLFDFRLAFVAVAGGVVVGAIAGIVASARAARISPANALRL